MQIDERVSQLLCSRICHELAGPVGAMSAGLEAIGDGLTDPAQGLELAQKAADQATRRLKFYRVAFGRGGLGAVTLAEVRELALGLFTEGPVTLEWPLENGVNAGEEAGAGSGRLLLNLVLLAREALPKGGTVRVKLAAYAEGTGVVLTAAGRGASLKADVRDAMAAGIAADALTPQTVHGHYVAAIAGALGAGLDVSSVSADELRIAALLPSR